MSDPDEPSDGCPNIPLCELFPVFSLQASLQTWQIRYCHSDYSVCERYKAVKRGEKPPLRLLPNGKMLPGPAESDSD